MRAPSDLPRRRARSANRGRIVLAVVLVAIVVLATSLRGIAGFYTDYLWFDSLGFSSVFTGVLGTRILLALAFTAAFFVVLWVNLLIADRLAPAFRPVGSGEEDFVERYQQLVGRRVGLVRVVVALLFALIAGVGVSGQWRSWILFRNAVDFDIDDPLFATDVGFYVFRLPFLSFVVNWAFAAVVIITIVTAAAHYLNGGIRAQGPGPHVSPQVKAHISVLLAVLALIRAAGYWLQRYELTLSTRGFVDGAGYTDVEAQLPAIKLLMLISLFAVVLLIVNIRSRGWVLPVIAVGLWGLVAVVAGAIYPAIIQRFQVQPAESAKEEQYIGYNIVNTQEAIGLADVSIEDYPLAPATAAGLANNAGTVRNIRQLDPAIVLPTFQGLQGTRGYYKFNDLDVDRYMINGQKTQVLLAARELNTGQLPLDTWEGTHLRYTNGYGVAMAQANVVTQNGRPDFAISDLPPQSAEGAPELSQPSLYFGEDLPGYAIVNTSTTEIAYLDDEGNVVNTRYDGGGGVSIGSFVRRAAFAARFGNLNPILSDFITEDSRILYVRDVKDRVQLLAPFLEFDADPYPVVLGGRVQWILDAYTTSDRYPYAERADNSELPNGSGLNGRFNYVRNSVKAVVDGYNGNVTFYVVDDDDPLVQAYIKAFPDLFTPSDQVPEDLKAHFRYPEDLFRVQTNMWGRYHIEDAGEFYNQVDAWSVAQDPGISTQGQAPSVTINEAGEAVPGLEERIAPYYQLMQLPAEGEVGGPPTDEQFVVLRTFVPASGNDSQRRLTAFMTAGSDPEHYGKLRVFVMPRSNLPDGPSQVAAAINQENEIAQELSLLDQTGSRVEQGNLLLLPIDNSLVWVRPLYVRAQGATAVPELRKVIVTVGERSYMGDSLAEALELAFGVEPEVPDTVPDPDDDGDGGNGSGPDTSSTTSTTTPTTATTTPTTVPDGASVADLLARADQLLTEAEVALREGDLGTYQEKVDEAAGLIRRASQLAGTTVAPPTTASDGGGDDGDGEDDGDGGTSSAASVNLAGSGSGSAGAGVTSTLSATVPTSPSSSAPPTTAGSTSTAQPPSSTSTTSPATSSSTSSAARVVAPTTTLPMSVSVPPTLSPPSSSATSMARA